MTKVVDALEQAKTLPPQSKVSVMRGVDVRRTKGGIPIMRIHYSANPDRDPEINPDWRIQERKTYSTEAAWQREQEIVDEAGGGELVFADTLITHWSKIVITDPRWRPDPRWKCIGGFDHGKTNPTALERCYVDHDGRKYLAGEYYVAGRNVWEHAPEILKMPDLDKMSDCLADPSVFDQVTQQEKGKQAKAIVDLYIEEGIHFLNRFGGNRNDQTFAERLLLHWKNLEENEPTLFIVCRNYSEQPQFGLHPWDCPNLLWELMRTRRRKLTAQQLLTQNVSEEIIDKDNHARDCLKQILMSLPEPTEYTKEEKIQQRLGKLDVTTAMAKYKDVLHEVEEEGNFQIPMGRMGGLRRLR